MQSSMPIPRPVARSPHGRWPLAVAMPEVVLGPAASLPVAARCVLPCLTPRCHAKLVMPTTSERTHK
eukprot:11934154-Alexandrium_andersonii.AAC.1